MRRRKKVTKEKYVVKQCYKNFTCLTLKIRRHAKLYVHAVAEIVESIILPLPPVAQANGRIGSRAKGKACCHAPPRLADVAATLRGKVGKRLKGGWKK
jgi:hypothetical protein